MTHVIYVLKLFDGTYYTGYTNDLVRRMQEHREGTGSRYVKGRRPFQLVYQEKHSSIKEAMRWERKIKKMSRSEKEFMIRGR